MKYTAVATCYFGLESVLAFELKRIGAENVRADNGRVFFDADGEGIAKANMWLRTAERVLIILKEYKAATFDELFDGAYSVAWGDVIDKTDAFPVKGYSMNSALTSVPACQSVLKKALVKRLQSHHKSQFLPENGRITKRIRFSIVKDVCTLMLDTSGDGLHKRGYRPLMNEAPIKETLAAGICDFARVFPESRVVDPFCGSGTLVIEAAMRARRMAPGLRRSFAAESYAFLGDGVFKRVRKDAEDVVDRSAEFKGRGFDTDGNAAALAAANAERAGVADCVSFEKDDARKLSLDKGEIILANPPYGERLMEEAEVEKLYADFGKGLENKEYKGLYIISSHPEFEKHFGKPAKRRRKLYNGMLPCQLFMYF